MPAATQVITSFLGGEISQFAQGRYDRPDYRTSMRTCLNSMPIESGAWTRRPGTLYGGTTRGGAQGRVIKFDFESATPYTIELTGGYMRFRSGPRLVTTNDTVSVVAVSTANPAVVQVASAVSWVSGNTVYLPGASTPLLENRQFTITIVDTTHFSIADAITGATIDGSTLGALVSGATVVRVQEVQTPYVGQLWSGVRAVQAETTDIFLEGSIAPQALTVTTLPTSTSDAVFSLASAIFQDGPYLDPFTNGVRATPTGTSGIINLTLSFPTYSATTAYTTGQFVTSSGVNYKSLKDQNVGNTPASSPTFWQSTPASAAVNNGQGFLGTDIGRLVRLLSEPQPWDATASYAVGNVVSYNPSGEPGAATYWQSLTASNANHAPGSDLTNWQLLTANAAEWTWGRITGLSTLIDRALSGSSSIGDMTGSGGLDAAFDGVFSKPQAASADKFINPVGILPAGTRIALTSYLGKNYAPAGAQRIAQVTIYPTSDLGVCSGSYQPVGQSFRPINTFTNFNLFASNSPPASSADGTFLGASGFINNTGSAITVTSSDTTTAWKYVWVEQTTTTILDKATQAYSLNNSVAQLSFFGPPGTGTGDGVQIEILGAALLYGNAISTWRLGLYSNTTGWPTCGCYDGGRLFLGGAAPNRWDASVANGISGGTINFAPTNVYGVVAADSAISYTFNSDSVNPIYWMSPELQGIAMGTLAGEWLVQAPTNGPLSPTNVAARRVTKIGCANVEPRRTEHTTIFVKRYGRKLMEYFADVYSGKLSAPNLADKAQHITRTGIAELAYTEAVNPVIWGRNADGSFFGITYKRDTLTTSQPPTFYGWHRHTLGSGRTVESICSGPSVGGDLDALTMVTNDTTTGVRHVELLTDTPDELTDLASCWFLDDAVNPTSVSASNVAITGGPYGALTINGLWHLNGKTVQVFAGGLDCGDRGDNSTTYTDFLVTNGSVVVPFGDGVSSGPGRGLFTQDYAATLVLTDIVVGFTYNSDGQIVRLVAQADTGARNGPAMGAPSRSHRAALKLVNTKGMSIGGNFTDTMYPCLFKNSRGDDIGTLDVFSGVFYDQVRDDFTYEDSLCWRVSRPYPATVTAAAQNLRTEDM